MSPLVSIVIPVFGKFDYTRRCLDSIASNKPAVSFEIIVVDDFTYEKLSCESSIRLICNDKNLGFIRSCNRGAEAAQGNYVCFLNNDTEVLPGWLDALVDTFNQHSNVGLVGSKLLFPDGKLQEAGGIVWRDGSAWNYGRGQEADASRFNYVRDTDYCSGASILIEKAFFFELGAFDERFVPAYCEDASLAFAVRAAGKRVIYQPRSVVIHHEGVSSGTDLSTGVKAYQRVNQGKFLDLWRSTLEAEHFPNAEHVPLACERSHGKPRVLFIDHYVPQFDRDAGSRTIFQLIKIFLGRGFSVKLWPDNLFRDPHYTPILESMGVEVIYGPEYVNHFSDWLGENGKYLTHVFSTRPHVSNKYLDLIRQKSNARIMYYGQDLHYLRLLRQSVSSFDIALVRNGFADRQAEERLWEVADVIFYPSAEETDIVANHIKKRKLPSKAVTLPVYAFDHFEEAPRRNLGSRKDIIFVAGFAHPPNVEGAKWFCNEVLPLVATRVPGVRLHLVGSNPTPEVARLANEQVSVTGYVTDEALADYYRNARAVVAPLLYGAGMKGKIAEAMRFGVPSITTSTGAQGFLDALDFMAVENTPESFADAVVEVLLNDAVWARRSVAALQYAKDRFGTIKMEEVLDPFITSGA